MDGYLINLVDPVQTDEKMVEQRAMTPNGRVLLRIETKERKKNENKEAVRLRKDQTADP